MTIHVPPPPPPPPPHNRGRSMATTLEVRSFTGVCNQDKAQNTHLKEHYKGITPLTNGNLQVYSGAGVKARRIHQYIIVWNTSNSQFMHLYKEQASLVQCSFYRFFFT